MDNQLRQIIEEAWNDRALLAESRVREAVRAVIEELDKGRLRTAEPIDPSRSQWQVNEWVKKAILLYFPMQEMRTMQRINPPLKLWLRFPDTDYLIPVFIKFHLHSGVIIRSTAKAIISFHPLPGIDYLFHKLSFIIHNPHKHDQP